MDFDSPGPLEGENFAVSVTFSQAVDGIEHEGLLFDTSGTEVTVEVTPPTELDRFTIVYTLQGSDNYTTYQSVRSLTSSPSPIPSPSSLALARPPNPSPSP